MKGVPEVPVEIRVECDVYPSEDPAKVVRAAKNVIGNCSPELIDGRLRVLTKNLETLSTIYEQVRSRRILGVFSKVLMRNMQGNSTWFYLNKQAAYAGTVSICEEESESPLGPIKVTIASDRLEAVVDWLMRI